MSNETIKSVCALALTDQQKAAFVRRILVDSGIAPVSSADMVKAPGNFVVLGSDRFLPISADVWAMVKGYLDCIHTT